LLWPWLKSYVRQSRLKSDRPKGRGSIIPTRRKQIEIETTFSWGTA